MPSLELCDVAKAYTGGPHPVRAVDGVSLLVEPGELLALYGPSGSGKTTLLLLAAGLATPDRGTVLFGGVDVGALSERDAASFRLRDVGFVFQSFHLMPHSSALDNATIKLTAAGLTLREARAAAMPWLERVGLADRAQHTPEQLSMGERQRVAIARALAGEPRMVLADEPTGNLDSARSAEILALIRDVGHERGIPALLATHDPAAGEVADRMLALSDGRLRAEAPASAPTAP